MATLASATLDLARILGNVVEGSATAGATTYLRDSNLPRTAPPTDAYKLGTIWFKSCTETALNGLTAITTAWVTADYQWTFAAQTKTITAGDTYAFVDKDWPRDVLRRAVNEAMATLGGLPDEYTLATFVTVADQMTYTLPTGVYNVKKVEVASSTTSPYYYVPNYHWEEIDGNIRFLEGHAYGTAGYPIRLTYQASPTEVTTDTGSISSYYHPDLLKWTAAVSALMWKLGANTMADGVPIVQSKLAYATQMAEMMKQRHRLPHVARAPKLSMWLTPNGINADDEPNKVHL